jgi:hypothetical protein
MNVIGKEATVDIHIVEISTNIPTINQLAFIKIQAIKVFPINVFGFSLSFQITFCKTLYNTSAIKAKLAKFLIIFHIFQRYISKFINDQ